MCEGLGKSNLELEEAEAEAVARRGREAVARREKRAGDGVLSSAPASGV